MAIGDSAERAAETSLFAISDFDVVFRRLSDAGPSMIALDPLTGVKRPASAAFSPDDDGISVYVEAVLTQHGLRAKDVTRNSQNVVASLDVAEIRALELDVRPDPWPSDSDDPEHPRNAAHALIVGFDDLSKRQRLRLQRSLATSSSLRCVYPPGTF